MSVSTYPPSAITLGQVSLGLPASVLCRVREFSLHQEKFVHVCIHLSPFCHYFGVGQFRLARISIMQGQKIQVALQRFVFVQKCKDLISTPLSLVTLNEKICIFVDMQKYKDLISTFDPPSPVPSDMESVFLQKCKNTKMQRFDFNF